MGQDAVDAALVRATLTRLSRSRFRSGFTLTARDLDYLRAKGRETIREHALRFLTERLAPAHPRHDGRQTPWRGHPVFVAQHATACCCRGCAEKWHGIPRGRALTDAEVARLCTLLMAWLTARLEADRRDASSATGSGGDRDQRLRGR